MLLQCWCGGSGFTRYSSAWAKDLNMALEQPQISRRWKTPEPERTGIQARWVNPETHCVQIGLEGSIRCEARDLWLPGAQPACLPAFFLSFLPLFRTYCHVLVLPGWRRRTPMGLTLEDFLLYLGYIFQTLMCIAIIWGSFLKCRRNEPGAGFKNLCF